MPSWSRDMPISGSSVTNSSAGAAACTSPMSTVTVAPVALASLARHCDVFLWREWDATKDSVSMVAAAYNGHEALLGNPKAPGPTVRPSAAIPPTPINTPPSKCGAVAMTQPEPNRALMKLLAA